MGTFKQFLIEVEEAAPAGVDPEMWANPSYRKFWQAQNQQQPQAAQTQPGWKPVSQQQGQGAPLQGNQGYQDLSSIENSIRTYLDKQPGFPSTGTVRNLPDIHLKLAITKGIRDKSIPIHDSIRQTLSLPRGVHFYYDRNRGEAFTYNRR